MATIQFIVIGGFRHQITNDQIIQETRCDICRQVVPRELVTHVSVYTVPPNCRSQTQTFEGHEACLTLAELLDK
jgi:hypothetical protein